MDKETLSNYGWIVICVLILAVMIALATPFGHFIAGAIKSTTAGFFTVNQNALSSTGLPGLNIPDQEFDGENGGGNGGGNAEQEPDYGTNETIPAGGTYTTVDGTVLTEGDEFPAPQQGDVYNFGDYEYCYGYQWGGSDWSNKEEWTYEADGWAARYMKNESIPTEMLKTINNRPIVDASSAYANCINVTKVPKLPSTITKMEFTFSGCDSLQEAPEIPDGVTSIWGIYSLCKQLSTYEGSADGLADFSNYKIPNSVTLMTDAFMGTGVIIPQIPNGVVNIDSAFTTAMSGESIHTTVLAQTYVIPNSVQTMVSTFQYGVFENNKIVIQNATNMRRAFAELYFVNGLLEVEINSNPSNYSECFAGVDFNRWNIKLTGSSSILDAIGATGTNYCPECNGTCAHNH